MSSTDTQYETPSTELAVYGHGGGTVWLAVCLAAALCFLCLPAYRRLRARCCGRAARHDGVEVTAFANHKGGVGKTTIALMCAKRLAEADAANNVLLVDCSLFGDLTRRCGVSQVPREKTIEAFAERAAANSAWSRRWCCCSSSTDPTTAFVCGASGFPNLFVLSSAAQQHNAASGSEHSIDPGAVPATAAGLRAMLAADFMATGRRWTVIADTDGGLSHAMTKLALCLADTVTVPVNADPDDEIRMRVLLNLLAKLRAAKLSVAEVGGAFFNKLPVKNNSPDEPALLAGLPFAISPAHLNAVSKLRSGFAAAADEFPGLFPTFAATAATEAGNFFSGVRSGGVGLERAKEDLKAELSEGVRGDVDGLVEQIRLGLSMKRKLHF